MKRHLVVNLLSGLERDCISNLHMLLGITSTGRKNANSEHFLIIKRLENPVAEEDTVVINDAINAEGDILI